MTGPDGMGHVPAVSDTMIEIRLATVDAYRLGDGGSVEFCPTPGWEITTDYGDADSQMRVGPNSVMVTTTELPDWLPPVARGAAAMLREFGELTPQQVACANAAVAVLVRGSPP